MSSGSEIPSILANVRDWWGLAALTVIGWFVLMFRYGREFFSPLCRWIFRKRMTTTDILFNRIRALEKDHAECQSGLRAAQREAYDAKVRVAQVESLTNAIKHENNALAASIKSLENLLFMMAKERK